MELNLYVLLVAGLIFSGLVMAGLTIAFQWKSTDRIKIRPENGRRIPDSRLYKLVFFNSVMSLAYIFGVAWLGYEQLFYEGSVAVWTIALELCGILLLYDFVYYLAHRFLLHGRIKYFYKVHVLHHTAQYPQAKDSLYVHPVETMIGLTLILGSTWVIGPVHVLSFALMFWIYSVMNIVIHGGLGFDRFPFRFFGYMASKHDRHHLSMKSGNYASITPIFDLLFGTAE